MMESVMSSVNAKRKSEGEGSGVVVTPSGSSVHQPQASIPSTSHCAGPPKAINNKDNKVDIDKGLDELESTLEGYFTYIGAKITDVATAGTAPKSQTDPTGKNTCQVCGKVNASWLDMRKHMRTHADFKPYKCNLCPRSFHDMYKLKRHLIIHSGLKPYQCHICDQKLSRAEHLRRHLLIHKETKPFKCNLCDFSARRTDSVRSHQKSKHPGEWVHVVTVKSIVDIVTDATTITTNLTPNPKRKKKKKKLINTTPTIYTPTTSTSAQRFGSLIPSIAELSRISGLSLPKLEPADTPTTTSSRASSSGASSSTSSNIQTMPHSSSSSSHYVFPGSTRNQGPGLRPGSTSSPRVNQSSPSPSTNKQQTDSPNPGMNSPPPKFLSRSHHHVVGAGGPDLTPPPGAMSAPLSVPSRPPLHPVIGMNPVSQTAAAGLNYYPSLPGQFMGAPVPSSQSISPYFAMKPVFPEAMPVNQHHVNRMAHGPHPSHHKQEPLNCSQGKPNMYSNNNHRMGSPNS